MKFRLFLISIFLSGAVSADVWTQLRQEFSLFHEPNRPEVQEQIRWLCKHPNYIQAICRQARPYIYHVLIELKKRQLPGELALLPMLESAYDPFAYSEKGAAGLWQLMPHTAKDLGLRQDWWVDGRRGIRSSTDAALAYLLYLNKCFNGNWTLTLAAYDAGLGTLSRAIKGAKDAHQSVDFWNLMLPKETSIYVPRFLALAELFKNPTQYHIDLINIPYAPYFEEVNIGSPIDLEKAARLAGMTYKDLIKLNPGYNRFTTPPDKPFQLLIPKENVQRFSFNLANLPIDRRVSWTKYCLNTQDNLPAIANRYHTTVQLIKEFNQLNSNELRPKQCLFIPKAQNAPIYRMTQSQSPLKPRFTELKRLRLIHIVQAHEGYREIEKIYGIGSKEIQLWNRLVDNSPLYAGQQLIIFKENPRAHS